MKKATHKNTHLRKACLVLLLFSCISGYSLAQQTILYISLDGNDNWSGTISSPNNLQSDGPFRTFERATAAVAKIQESKKNTQSISVLIRGGNYALSKTVHLDSRHNASTRFRVTWKNFKNEKVLLLGGREISGFHTISDLDFLQRINPAIKDSIIQFDLATADISDFGAITNRGRPGMELFFNQKKMQPARWPNEGWALIADVPQSGELVYAGELPHMRFELPVGKHYGRFSYTENRPGQWQETDEIALHGYWVWNWFDEYLSIAAIDTSQKQITIKAPHSQYGYCKEQRYYAVNVLEELGRPGEWYINRKKGILLFWPPKPVSSSEVFLSLLDAPLFELNNTKNIHIEGISFAYSRGSGLVIKGGENNLVAGCDFNNLGDVAVRIEGGKNNGIKSCDIYDVALGGVLLQGGDRKTLTEAGNFVTNCHIYDFSQWIRTYQSAINVSGVGNYIANNNIHNGPGTGILLTGNEHRIEYNDMHDLALETADVGAFYMGRDWTERGNTIRYNYFHELNGQGTHDVNAVYLDDWASGTTVSGNIFVNCARGIMVGGGRDNLVDNNVFINCNLALHIDSRGLGWAKYYFDGTDSTLFRRMAAMNYKLPPYAVKYPALLSLYDSEPAVARNNTIQHNISYNGRWMDLLDGLDFNLVNTKNNLLVLPEPGLVSKRDFILGTKQDMVIVGRYKVQLNATARRYGIQDIPYKKIGLQIDAFRKTKPQSSNHPDNGHMPK